MLVVAQTMVDEVWYKEGYLSTKNLHPHSTRWVYKIKLEMDLVEVYHGFGWCEGETTSCLHPSFKEILRFLCFPLELKLKLFKEVVLSLW